MTSQVRWFPLWRLSDGETSIHISHEVTFNQLLIMKIHRHALGCRTGGYAQDRAGVTMEQGEDKYDNDKEKSKMSDVWKH